MKDAVFEGRLHSLGRLIRDLRYYTEEDLRYVADKLEEGYDELCSLFGDRRKDEQTSKEQQETAPH